MKHIAILGFGREGKAVFKFLKKNKDYKNAHIEIRDKKFDDNYLRELEKFDIIFRSPGIPYTLPEIQGAKRTGAKISSATELFFNYCPCNIIGITGTKGKSTTATLLYKILRASGKDAHLAGNIGKPAIEILPKLKRNSFVVFELSSFQLQELQHSPHIAVVLGIFPDHMDAHKNFREYVEAKSNITKWQKRNDIVFYANDNKYARAIAQKSIGKKIPYRYRSLISDIASREFPTCDVGNNTSYSRAMPRTERRSPHMIAEQFIRGSGTRKLENKIRDLIRLPGEHQLKNALMSSIIAHYLGVTEKTILKTIAKFKGLPHRIEFVRRIIIRSLSINSRVLENTRIDRYIEFFDDSASTNPQTAAAAVNSFKNPIILLAGGKDKNLDYKPLRKALEQSSVVNIILYGENRNKIAKAILSNKRHATSDKKKVYLFKELNNAVDKAFVLAKKSFGHVPCYMSHVTILLSPASASFDQFNDYKQRGEEFKKIVNKLK